MSARLLGPEDWAAFREVRLEALTLFPASFITTKEEFASRSDDEHREALAAGKTWGAFDGATLIAMGALLPEPYAAAAHRASIGAFYARQSHHGTGAADTLLSAMKQASQAHGIWQLELFVADTNPRAFRFYARHGFVEMGRLPNAAEIEGVMTSDIFMVADLR